MHGARGSGLLGWYEGHMWGSHLTMRILAQSIYYCAAKSRVSVQ